MGPLNLKPNPPQQNCNACGAHLLAGRAFCVNCGTPVSGYANPFDSYPPGQSGYPPPGQPDQYFPSHGQSVYAAAKPRVFISHSHANDSFTKRLTKDLQAAGVDVWVDMENLAYGDFMTRINEALGSCEWLLLVLTPEALTSPAVKWEVNVALNMVWNQRMKAVIPIIAERCDLQQVPPIWSTLHYYDATKDYRAALASLLRALGV